MKSFSNMESFSKHLSKVLGKHRVYEAKLANFIGQALVVEGRDKIGHEQERWEPLKEKTIQDKERQGYIFNSEGNPLYRTGELRDSITYHFNPTLLTLFFGSTSDLMVYQELGTKYIPPRSVIGLTMFQFLHGIHFYFGEMLTAWISDRPLRLRRRTHGSI